MNSGLYKNVISKMFTNHMYYHLIMCKQIADVELNCWCYVAVVFGAIWLYVDRLALACLEYYLLSFHVYKQNLALSGLQGLLCHKTQQTNQENIFFLKKIKSHLFLNI